ncbi:uncharacterized protein, partial [Argopecten irradians]|uniref:uncharacterized protein n=1 Tax=Argopecten irradians TaxID=31199 RepID=UPI00371AF809
ISVHSLACENGWKGKLRFGQNIRDPEFVTVFDRFLNYNVTQTCTCYACNCTNSCDSCKIESVPDFFCNCKFNKTSNATAVRHGFTSTTDYVSAAHQTEETGTNTTAIVGGLLAVVVVSIGVTVIVFVCRRQRNKKAPDYSDSCIANPSYGETHDDQKCAGLDNMGYEESDKEVHTYDMADQTKPEVSGELDYSYANFGGQSNSQEQTMNLNKTDSHKLQSENNDYDLANASSPQNNYFVIEKSSPSNLTGACFISETGDNDANERAETMRNGTVSPGADNYFLLEESDSATTATGSEQLSGVLGKNYFLVEQQSVSETKNSEQDVYELAHSQSHMKNFGDRKTETRGPAQQYQDDDPYDHARIGHVRTNGFDDGVYDELKKQNVRYRDDDVDNDYDHC